MERKDEKLESRENKTNWMEFNKNMKQKTSDIIAGGFFVCVG